MLGWTAQLMSPEDDKRVALSSIQYTPNTFFIIRATPPSDTDTCVVEFSE